MSRNGAKTVDMEKLHGIFQSDGFATELIDTKKEQKNGMEASLQQVAVKADRTRYNRAWNAAQLRKIRQRQTVR